MLKNIIIILTLCLLLSTMSLITPVGAQKNSVEISTDEDFNSEPNGEDYAGQVNERFVIAAMKSLYEAESEYMIKHGNGSFGTS